MKYASFAALVAAAATTLAGAATAQARTTVVSYADLDLTRPAGVRVLEDRIGAAVTDVCGDRTRLLAMEAQRRACVRAALGAANGQLAAARSTQFAKARGVIVLSRADR